MSDSVTSYQTQAKSIGKGADVSQASTQDKVASLKADQLASATKEYADQKATVDKLNAQIKSTDSAVSDDTLHADQSGTLHVFIEKAKPKYLSKGSEIAAIYPQLKDKPALDVTFMVPANKISGIKIGEHVRFRISKSVSKPVVVQGTVHDIDTTATSTKDGNYFKVVAHVDLTNSEYNQVKYGTEGVVIIITGKKTWFNYVKDQVFKDD